VIVVCFEEATDTAFALEVRKPMFFGPFALVGAESLR
jgi:hypothetical protein